MQLPGMIDWLTLRLDGSHLNVDDREKVKSMSSVIMKINSSGEKEWESISRESIRSDSHQVTVKFGSFLEIHGSPARVLSGNNVFGCLDIRKCFFDMVTFVATYYGIFIPRNYRLWSCSKIDITRNYDMGSLDQVMQAIDCLRHVKVGRQKLRSDDNGCGWGYGSSLHMGKAYAKGPHSRKLSAQKKAFFTDIELNKADRLLRLEYGLRRHMIARIKKDTGLEWFDFSQEFLIDLHDKYFSQFISGIEVADMDTILDKLLASVGDSIPTEGQARSSYDCYTRIRMMGFKIARGTFTKTTWYRHLENLRAIGLTDVDLQPINVVPLRRRQIVLDQPVSSWDDIKIAL